MNKKEADTQSETSDKPEVNEEAGDTQENSNTAKAQESENSRAESTKNSNESASTPKEDFKSLYLRSVADLENFENESLKINKKLSKWPTGLLLNPYCPLLTQ